MVRYIRQVAVHQANEGSSSLGPGPIYPLHGLLRNSSNDPGHHLRGQQLLSQSSLVYQIRQGKDPRDGSLPDPRTYVSAAVVGVLGQSIKQTLEQLVHEGLPLEYVAQAQGFGDLFQRVYALLAALGEQKGVLGDDAAGDQGTEDGGCVLDEDGRGEVADCLGKSDAVYLVARREVREVPETEELVLYVGHCEDTMKLQIIFCSEKL